MPMIDLVAPGTGEPLREECDHLVSPRGEKYPAVGGIPRFVPSDGLRGVVRIGGEDSYVSAGRGISVQDLTLAR